MIENFQRGFIKMQEQIYMIFFVWRRVVLPWSFRTAVTAETQCGTRGR
jgi:hypothetical protein